jgi:signal peptide peptidase SppA
VILRVDSPGGSALASDAMWRELNCAVTSLKEKHIPLVVSMANTAASGGYYVSGLSGIEVWASPLTITGSIGVVAGKYEASGLLSQLGIKRVAINSGPRANYYSPSTPWSEAEFAKLNADLDAAYHDFVTKMAAARQLTFEQLHTVAQGRVWTGSQAKSHQLVDRLGGLFDVCQSLSNTLQAPIGELAFWNPETKGGFDRLKQTEQDTPLLSTELAEATLGPLLDSLRFAQWFATERTLMLSPIQFSGTTPVPTFTSHDE